jgi:hypothetical protein
MACGRLSHRQGVISLVVLLIGSGWRWSAGVRLGHRASTPYLPREADGMHQAPHAGAQVFHERDPYVHLAAFGMNFGHHRTRRIHELLDGAVEVPRGP